MDDFIPADTTTTRFLPINQYLAQPQQNVLDTAGITIGTRYRWWPESRTDLRKMAKRAVFSPCLTRY